MLPKHPRKKFAPSLNIKSGEYAFLQRIRCSASLHEWKVVARSQQAKTSATQNQLIAGLLQKTRAGSSLESRPEKHFNCRRRSAHHASPSPSGSNGCATSLPSAFFNKISTLPSASSSCFWHSRESATPSSNNFMASSSDSCGLSSFRTTSSSRARERSKSGFFASSGFLGTGVFTRPFQVALIFSKRATSPEFIIPPPKSTNTNQLDGHNSILSQAQEPKQFLCAAGRPFHGFSVKLCFLIAASAVSLNGAVTGFPSYQY